jgi:transposase-like protein
MKPRIKLIQKKRSYSEDFKRSLVKDFESGRLSVIQLGKLHGISFQLIYRWIYHYSTLNEQGLRIVEKSKSSTQKVKDLERKVAELERSLGQKQVKIDFLEKMIDIAKDELDIDIKKNSNTSQSGGSKKGKSN